MMSLIYDVLCTTIEGSALNDQCCFQHDQHQWLCSRFWLDARSTACTQPLSAIVLGTRCTGTHPALGRPVSARPTQRVGELFSRPWAGLLGGLHVAPRRGTGLRQV